MFFYRLNKGIAIANENLLSGKSSLITTISQTFNGLFVTKCIITYKLDNVKNNSWEMLI